MQRQDAFRVPSPTGVSQSLKSGGVPTSKLSQTNWLLGEGWRSPGTPRSRTFRLQRPMGRCGEAAGFVIVADRPR